MSSRATDSHEPAGRDYVAIALAFARDAVADTQGLRHNKWVRLAAARHLCDIDRAATDQSWPFWFSAWHGADICDFVEKLPHVEGAWASPTIVLGDWQVFGLVVQFGWRRRRGEQIDPQRDPRRFTKAYWEVARKNGKSTLLAACTLYGLTCEGESGPQILIGATTGSQALKVFSPAKMMVQRTSQLRDAFDVAALSRSILCRGNGGFIQPINAKSTTQDGWNPHWVDLDELHAHKDRGLFDVMRSAFGARANPLMWTITTAGYNLAGVCYEERTALCKVLEQALVLDHYFGVIFTLDETDDPWDETKWIKANPGLPIAPSLESLRSDALDAKASPSSAGEFKTKRLNMWLGAASAWLPMPQWNAAADPALSWDDFAGLDCWIGGDLADKDDITALVLAAFDAQDRLIFKPIFYLPKEILTAKEGGLRPDQAEQYRAWAEAGHLVFTEGDFVDHNVVEKQIIAWIERYSIRKATFDQFAAAQQMASRLNETYMDSQGGPIAQILHKKASNVTDPAKELEARVKVGPRRVRHDGNPVMTWMASNAVVSRRTDGTILPKKDHEMSPNKIDGVDGLVNAIHPAVVPGEGGESSYETEGLLVI